MQQSVTVFALETFSNPIYSEAFKLMGGMQPVYIAMADWIAATEGHASGTCNCDRAIQPSTVADAAPGLRITLTLFIARPS